MADTATFKINIDTDELNDALAKLEKLSSALKKREAINAGGGKGASATISDGGGGLGGGIFGRSTPSKFLTDRRLTNSDSNIAKFGKISTSIEKAWRGSRKELERSVTALREISREILKIGGITIGAGATGVAAGAAAGVVKSADDFAAKNLSNRQLGLKPGEKEATEIDYAKAGMAPGMIEQWAGIKADRQQWTKAMALGIGPAELQTKSAAELAAEALEKSGQKFKQYGEGYGQWAKSAGVDTLFDTLTARGASTFSAADYAQMHERALADQKKLAVPQTELDQGSEAHARFRLVGQQIQNSLEGILVKLAPNLSKLGESVAGAIAAFGKSDKLGAAIDNITEDIDKLDHWFRKLTGQPVKDDKPGSTGSAPKPDAGASNAPSTPTSTNKPKDAAHKVVAAGVGGIITTTAKGIRWAVDGLTRPSLKFTPDANKTQDFAAFEKANGLDAGTLQALENLESNGGRQNVGPITKAGWRAKGPFQLSPDSLKDAGISAEDAGDEKREAQAAAAKMRALLKEFGGDKKAAFSAYNAGDGTVKALQKKYGDKWADHLPAETGQYLLRAQQLEGVDFDHGSALAQLNSPHNTVSADSSNVLDRLTTAAEKLASYAKEGGGSQFRTPASPQIPTINVNVSAPAGSNVAVTSSTLPH